MIGVFLFFNEDCHGLTREAVAVGAGLISFFLGTFLEVTLSTPTRYYSTFASLAALIVGGSSLLRGEEIWAGSTI
jgi:hypothetical protein